MSDDVQDAFDDDDFGDFGGFEAAEAVAPQEAKPLPVSLEAGPSPWAIMTGNASILGGTDNQSNTPAASTTDGTEEFAAFQQFPVQDTSQDPQSSVPWLSGASPSVVTESTSSGDADQKQQSSVTLSNGSVEKPPSVSASPLASGDSPHMPDKHGSGETMSRLQTELEKSNEEKLVLDKELKKLTIHLKETEEKVEHITKQLEEQQEKYKEIQEKHNAELDGLRTAGHDALAVVVEEYKELHKVTSLQHQQTFIKELENVIKVEAERCRDLLQTQEASFKEELDKERDAMNEQIKEALDKQQEEHKSAMQEALKLEQEKYDISMRAAVERAVNQEKEESRKAIASALQEERDQTQKLLVEERDKLQLLMEEERAKCRVTLARAIEEEQKSCQESIKSTISEEQKIWEGKLQEAVQAAVESTKVKLKEQAEADAVVRRRALAGTDILLEAARKQLDALLSTQPNQELAS